VPRVYFSGMLLALLLIQDTPPLAVEVTGMAPQIAYARRTAAGQAWPVTCEGRSGEEQVLRLAPAGGMTREAVAALLETHVSSIRYYYSDGEQPGRTCDQEPAVSPSASNTPFSTLAVGPEDRLAPLAEIARACGFSRARVRQWRPGDLPAGTPGLQSGWRALDAGEDTGPRHGPTVCFVQMRGAQG
jgi:hypothetical protein